MEEAVNIVKKEIALEKLRLQQDNANIDDWFGELHRAVLAKSARTQRIAALEAGLRKLEGVE